MPKVSVIVPIYKVEPFIERCARSLFEQTLDDIEYVFVNDCTPDGSMDVLLRVLEDYPSRKAQVKIVNMPVNSGQAKVREKGVKSVTGDYVIHCDSDDWVDRTMYEKMWKKAVEGEYDMVLCGCTLTDGSKVISTYLNEFSVSKDIQSALISDEIRNYTWNKLIRRVLYDTVTEWPRCNLLEDVAIISPIAYNCRKIGTIEEPLYYYFQNPEGIYSSTIGLDKLRQIMENTELVIRYIVGKGAGTLFRKELLHKKCSVKLHCLNLSWKEYMSIYPETTLMLLFDSYLPIETKLGHVSKCFGIHGISKLFRR